MQQGRAEPEVRRSNHDDKLGDKERDTSQILKEQEKQHSRAGSLIESRNAISKQQRGSVKSMKSNASKGGGSIKESRASMNSDKHSSVKHGSVKNQEDTQPLPEPIT